MLEEAEQGGEARLFLCDVGQEFKVATSNLRSLLPTTCYCPVLLWDYVWREYDLQEEEAGLELPPRGWCSWWRARRWRSR